MAAERDESARDAADGASGSAAVAPAGAAADAATAAAPPACVNLDIESVSQCDARTPTRFNPKQQAARTSPLTELAVECVMARARVGG